MIITGMTVREIIGMMGRETSGMTMRDRDDEKTLGLGCSLAL